MSDAVRRIACVRCGKRKPATEKHFQPLERLARGFHSWCRQCHREYRRERYQRNPIPDKLQKDAYTRANARLRERHRTEFDRIYAQELSKPKVAS